MKRPPVPLPGYAGTKFDPPHAWLFAKGFYGPPDNRPHPRWGFTREQAKAWGVN